MFPIMNLHQDLPDKKIAYPKYAIFKTRLKLYLFKDVTLAHVPKEKSIIKVRKEMEEIGLLCPMVLDSHVDRIRSGTNRYLELKRQGYEGSIFYKTKNAHEAKFLQLINLKIFKNYPINNLDFIYEDDIKEIRNKCIDLIKENNL